jgi:plasmid stabilization system protein ParE
LLAAEADLDHLYAERFDRSEAAAERLLGEIEMALRLLSLFPRLAPIYHRPFRRFILKAERVGLYYTVEGKRPFIQALIDLRRSPATVRSRLGVS